MTMAHHFYLVNLCLNVNASVVKNVQKPVIYSQNNALKNKLLFI